MNVLHYYLDLLRNESFANCGQSLSNILNTWRVARNGKVGNENYDGIDFGNISFTDTYIHESANAEFSYKSHLHYYLDLLRDESHYECGYSLFNIINTWKISRDNVICGECFNRIDFGNVPFNGIDFSKDGKMPCSFSNAKLNIYNFRSGHYGIINCATISPDDKYILTGGRDKTAIIWERESGLVHAELNGHTDSIIFVKFSNSGQYCLTASLDNT